jgi:hypothetical protein
VNAFKRLWSGSLPLPTAFWGCLIGGGLAWLLAVCVIGAVAILSFPGARGIVYVTGFVITWAYLIPACVGTWRSASAAAKGSLRVVAKLVVGLLAVSFALNFWSGSTIVSIINGTWEPGSYLRDSGK